jgi:hypothetical protein
VNQIAARFVALSTGQPMPELTVSEEKRLRSEAAAILGRMGGSKGGKARAATLSADRRAEIARRAAVARWAKK